MNKNSYIKVIILAREFLLWMCNVNIILKYNCETMWKNICL